MELEPVELETLFYTIAEGYGWFDSLPMLDQSMMLRTPSGQAFNIASSGRAIELIKGRQPAGTKAGVKGQAQGLSQVAKDALARALGMPAAPQA